MLIMIDYENVQPKNIPADKLKGVDLMFFVGDKQPKVSLSFELETSTEALTVTLVKNHVGGKNALDMLISCELGRTMERAPERKYCIISKDKGYDALVRYYKDHKVYRYDSIADIWKNNATVKKQKPKSKTKTIKEMEAWFSGKNKPKTKSALCHVIESHMHPKKVSQQDIDEIITIFSSQKILAIKDDGKIEFLTLTQT